MQSLSTSDRARRPRLLVVELWGLGDLALAVPFLRAAARHTRVTLVAKPRARPLLRRFAPEVELIELDAPWTAFRSKYALARWPWRSLARTVRQLRAQRCDVGVSARVDPRDHLLLSLGGAQHRVGYARAGSGLLLTDALARPARPHRADHWTALAGYLGFEIDPSPPALRPGRRVAIHTGAGQRVREWPRERFEELARRLAAAGWEVDLLDNSLTELDVLLDRLARADRFIGNDSGPGHLAALLGVPTFTIFGPQLPELFAPRHPHATWIEGAPCRFKPCYDSCRFAEPLCILEVEVESVWRALQPFLRCGA